ncbi:MAG: hypothetical protein R3C49_14445 [Planctomycetaceae bacterium]
MSPVDVICVFGLAHSGFTFLVASSEFARWSLTFGELCCGQDDLV